MERKNQAGPALSMIETTSHVLFPAHALEPDECEQVRHRPAKLRRAEKANTSLKRLRGFAHTAPIETASNHQSRAQLPRRSKFDRACENVSRIIKSLIVPALGFPLGALWPTFRFVKPFPASPEQAL